jgi:hypothetical protein
LYPSLTSSSSVTVAADVELIDVSTAQRIGAVYTPTRIGIARSGGTGLTVDLLQE